MRGRGHRREGIISLSVSQGGRDNASGVCTGAPKGGAGRGRDKSGRGCWARGWARERGATGEVTADAEGGQEAAGEETSVPAPGGLRAGGGKKTGSRSGGGGAQRP